MSRCSTDFYLFLQPSSNSVVRKTLQPKKNEVVLRAVIVAIGELPSSSPVLFQFWTARRRSVFRVFWIDIHDTTSTIRRRSSWIFNKILSRYALFNLRLFRTANVCRQQQSMTKPVPEEEGSSIAPVFIRLARFYIILNQMEYVPIDDGPRSSSRTRLLCDRFRNALPFFRRNINEQRFHGKYSPLSEQTRLDDV